MAVVKNLMVRLGIDASELIGGMDKAEKKTEQTFTKMGEGSKKASIGTAMKGMSKDASAELDAVSEKIKQLTAFQDALNARMHEMQTSGAADPNIMLDLEHQSDNITRELDKLESRKIMLEVQVESESASEEMEELGQKASALSPLRSALSSIGHAMSTGLSAGARGLAVIVGGTLTTAFKGLTATAKGAWAAINGIGTAGKVALKGIGVAISPITKGISSLAGGLKRMTGMYLGFGLLTGVLGRMRSVISGVLSENAALKAQTDQLRASLAQALTPAITLVTNALSALMPYIVGVANAIGNLITTLFGKGWTTVAEGANAAAEATGGAAKAQEEYNRQLAGFDEMTKLSDDKNSSGGGGGGSSTTTTPVEGQMPGWITDIASQIKKAIAMDDWSGVGYEIASKLESLFSKAHEWMTSVDFGHIGKNVAQGINGAVDKFLEPDSVGLGTLITDWINAGIHGITGFSEELDWANVGRLLVKEISDFFTNMDWAGLFEGVGSIAGGLASAIGQIISDGVTAASDYFADEIEACGGDVMAGIWNGIKKAVTGAGTWIYDNVLVPLIDGFKETFQIHSPAANPELLEMAGYIGQGILSGIAAPFIDLKDWVVEHILTPIKNAINGSSGTKLEVNPEIGTNEGTVSGWWSKIKGWWDTAKSKNPLSKVSTSMSTKSSTVKGWASSVKTWWNNNKPKLGSVSTSFGTSKTSVSGWWNNVTSWWNGVKGTLSSVKVNATKGSGWSSMSTWLGGLQKYIHLSVSWKKPSGWIEEAISKYIFNSRGLPTLSFAARGGIVDRATLFGGNIVAGEAGREAIVPLERNTEWATIVANQMAGILANSQSNSQQPVNINLMLDGAVIGRASVKYINGQAVATGVNPLSAYI